MLHTLRDRLSAEQVAHLGSQLPLTVRGALFDQWRPGHKAEKIHKQAEFLAEAGIDSISVTPDRLLAVKRNVAVSEARGKKKVRKV